jgi:large subunit ribosomal protein L9
MQIILKEDMDNLGKSGEVVNVRTGYGRNYLLPRGLAVLATAGDIARVEHEKRVIAARTSKLAKEAQAEADRLSQVTVSIPHAVGEEDKLFGSVTSRDIAEALQQQGVTVDSKKIMLEEPIRALGLTEVPIKLGRGVQAKIKVWVVKKET